MVDIICWEPIKSKVGAYDISFRETVKLKLNEILQKYLESDKKKKESENK
jgi:hypothetical protein